MALRIPSGFANMITTLRNSQGGSSSEASVAVGLDLTAALSQADVDRIANLTRDGLKAFYDTDITVGPVKIYERAAGSLLLWQNTTTEVGTAGLAAYASPGLAIVVSKQTQLVGRAHRGRMYLPFVPEAGVDEAGVIAPATVTNLQTIVNNWASGLLADPSIDNLVLFHDEDSALAELPDVIQTWLVRNVVGSMRPRQRR